MNIYVRVMCENPYLGVDPSLRWFSVETDREAIINVLREGYDEEYDDEDLEFNDKFVEMSVDDRHNHFCDGDAERFLYKLIGFGRAEQLI